MSSPCIGCRDRGPVRLPWRARMIVWYYATRARRIGRLTGAQGPIRRRPIGGRS